MGRPRELVVDEANTLVHVQRIVGTGITVSERQPWARVHEPRRQNVELARGRSATNPLRDKFSFFREAPSRRAAWSAWTENRVKRLMIDFEATDGIRVQAAKCRCI